MGLKERAIRHWQRIQAQHQPRIQRRRGMLGNGAGVVIVPGRPDFNYVRINGDPLEIEEVFNDETGAVNNLSVIIEKEPDTNFWRVVSVDRGVITQVGEGWSGVKYTPTHGDEHEWPDYEPGPDVVNVFDRNIHSLRTEPTWQSYSLNVVVQPHRYSYEGVIKEYPGEILNVASYVPVTGIRQVLTYLDVRVNAAYSLGGSPVTYTASANPPPPRVPWFAKKSGLITLRQGQTKVTESDIKPVTDLHNEEGQKHNLQAQRVPTVNDDYTQGYSAGSTWVVGDVVYVCTNPSLNNASWIDLTGTANIVQATAGGRLTTESGVPVSTGDRTSQSTIYYTPDPTSPQCGQIGLYNGSNWALLAFEEISLTLSGLTSDTNYDVYVYNNAGTLTIDSLVAWTNDTTPASRTTQNGIYVKSGDTTRRLIGTIRTTSTTTTEDSESKRFVWNLFNQVKRELQFVETTDAWTYGSTTWRALNNSTSNRVEFVIGVDNQIVKAKLGVMTQADSAASGFALVGIGLDSTSVNSSDLIVGAGEHVNAIYPMWAHYKDHVGQGYHYLQGLERTGLAATMDYYGDRGFTDGLQSGMLAEVMG